MLRTIFLLLLFTITGCLSQDNLHQFTSDELVQLLAADSVKFWGLTVRNVNGETVIKDCELDDLMSLSRSLTTADTAEVIFSTGPIQCPGQTDSIIFTGSWLVPDTANAQLLLFVIDGDTNLMSIDFISSQFLQLSRYHDGNLIQEDYVQP